MVSNVCYDPRLSIDGLESYSPSAGKPAQFMDMLKDRDFYAFGRGGSRVKPVTREDLCLVNDKAYVDGVFAGTINNGFETRDDRVPESCLWTVGSLVTATLGAKVGILDCDFHYGDGTDDILKRKPALASQVIHRTSGKYFHDGNDPLELFPWLHHSIEEINAFGCDVVIYQAGADMHVKDPLGGLLNDEEMARRDRMVFRQIKAPVAWCLAGGYRGMEPVIETHHRTFSEARNAHEYRAQGES
jgi:hypothetical protein